MVELVAVAGKDLRRYLRDPVALLLWLGIPVLIGGLLVLATGRQGTPTLHVQLLVADEDDGFLSRMLLGAMNQGRAGDVVRVEKVDQAEGRKRMDRGDASALLVIPKGFSAAILKEEPSTLLLITNPSQRIGPDILEQMLRILSDAVFYLHRLLGPELKVFVAGPPAEQPIFPDAEIVRLSTSINQSMGKVAPYLFPPVIAWEIKQIAAASEKSNPGLPMAFYFLPGILMVSMLFAAQGLSGDLWVEREACVLRRIVTTPLGITWFLLGKLLAASAVLLGISLLLLSAATAYAQLPWARLPMAVIWSTATGVMLMALSLVVQVWASTRRGASFLSMAILIPLMMLGGSMFPLRFMPPWLAALGRCTPNGWAAEQLQAVLLGRPGPLELPLAFCVAAMVSAMFFFAAWWRIHRVFARS